MISNLSATLAYDIAMSRLLMVKLLSFGKDLDLSTEVHIRSRSSPYRIYRPAEPPFRDIGIWR
jgi:hypothetical protein